jgi:hypothetical protein
MKPLLAHIYEPHRVTYPCYVQPKLNGIRALYQAGRFQSRDEVPFPNGLLNHISQSLRRVFRDEVILDGELYVHGWPLQRINAAVTPVRQHPTEDTLKVEYHVFDVVDFGKSFEERHQIRQAIPALIGRGIINDVKTVHVNTQEEADTYYAGFVTAGYEGMMYRLGDCPYTVPKQMWPTPHPLKVTPMPRSGFLSDKSNRVWHLLKRKNWLDHEFLFQSLEITTGEKGERGFQMWCLAQNGKPFKLASGLTDAQLDYYIQNPPVGQKIKSKYLCLSSEGVPLNATIHPDHIIL